MIDSNAALCGAEKIAAYVAAFASHQGLHRIVVFENSYFTVFRPDLYKNAETHPIADIDSFRGGQFDLILIEPEIGAPRAPATAGDKQVRLRSGWHKVLLAIKHLAPTGTLIASVEPQFVLSQEGKEFEELLKSEGLFYQAAVAPPENILEPETSFQPLLVSISNGQPETFFIADLSSASEPEAVGSNFATLIDGGSIGDGVLVDRAEFTGITNYKIKRQIEGLETIYKSYKTYKLAEISRKITQVRPSEGLTDLANSIYIPSTVSSDVQSDFNSLTLKHHNYFQVELKPNFDATYVASYFRSAIGRLVLSSLASYGAFPKIRKSSLPHAIVAAPTLAEQAVIVDLQQCLRRLKHTVEELENEVALNPSENLLPQLNKMLESANALRDTDRVAATIRNGESKTIEFKETLSVDIKTGNKEKYIETSALKTICAFLNSAGGILLIGVADNGEVAGLERDQKIHKGGVDDGLYLHFKNLLKRSVGESFYPFVEYRLVSISTRKILMVECQSSPQPCYLDGKDFYVRTTPATDKLEGPKLVDYVQNHFGKTPT